MHNSREKKRRRRERETENAQQQGYPVDLPDDLHAGIVARNH
jgi:hypothetical protein